MTQSRTHYIPVSGITIETLKDIVEEAISEGTVGGDVPGVTIDPSIFCSYHGYIPNPDVIIPYIPPISYSDPGAEEIILLCADNFPSVIYFRVQGNYTVEVWDSAETTLIQSSNLASGAYYTYNFPTKDTGTLYIIKIIGRGSTLTLFRCHDITNSGYNTSWQIIEAKFNTPNMVTLSNAFEFIKTIKKVMFISAMNSVTTMQNFLRYSGIEEFKFHSSFNNLTNINSMFAESSIKSIDFDGISLPNLSSMNSFAEKCYELFILNLNPVCPKLGSMSLAFTYTRLKELIFDFTLGELVGGTVVTTQMAEYNIFLEKVIHWIGHANLAGYALSCLNAFRGNVKLKEVIYRGYTPDHNLAPNADTPSLRIIDCGYYFGINANTAILNPQGSVETVKLPSAILTGTGFPSTAALYTSLKELINTPATVSPIAVPLSNMARNLKRFDQPNMQVTFLRIGTNGGELEYVDVDWAGSTWTTNPHIQLYGNLSTAEINRIFLALPTIASKIIDVRYNPGYATCDKTIATAKGWTVT